MVSIRRRILQSSRCHGLTIIELLVCLGIISLLLAILLPAVQQARGSARRIQCLNNIRNLGIAVLGHADAKRRFPAAGYHGLYGEKYHNWVVDILPWLEQSGLHNQWDFSLQSTSPANTKLAQTNLPVLVCPDDLSAVGQGDLSFAVNSGFGWTTSRGVRQMRGIIDLNGDGTGDWSTGDPNDRQLLLKTGLFFVENWPVTSGPAQHHTLSSVTDGLTYTIMLADCIRSGADPKAPAGSANWASPVAERSAFYLSGYACEDLQCGPGSVNYGLTNHRAAPYATESINSARTQPEGKAPWASSFHAGGIHVAFADGRAVFLSDQIDGAVYAALLSSQGAEITGPLAQSVVSESAF